MTIVGLSGSDLSSAETSVRLVDYYVFAAVDELCGSSARIERGPGPLACDGTLATSSEEVAVLLCGMVQAVC